MAYMWMTTVPSGRAHTHGADDGQTGWKIHLVDESGLEDRLARTQYGMFTTPHGPALCGLRPNQGWGLDLFINSPCARCEKKAEKLGIELPKLPR